MPDLTYCEKEARRLDRDRFLCALFLPPEPRNHLCALLVFNQEVARIPEMTADLTLRRIRLQWWRDELAATRSGAAASHPVLAPLAAGLSRIGLPATALDGYFAARDLDADFEQPADMAAVETYGAATSGLIGEAAVRLLGGVSPSAVAAARDIGLAWTLVGLARSVPHHARLGRCHIPADLCREHGIEPDRLFGGAKPAGLFAAVAHMIARARELLTRARAERERIERSARPALLPAVLAEGYARTLERRGFDPFTAQVGRPGVAMLAGLAVKARLGRY